MLTNQVLDNNYVTKEQVIQYLTKIGYYKRYPSKEGKLPINDYATLCDLLDLHLKAIPFGSLSLHYYNIEDKPISPVLNILNPNSSQGINLEMDAILNKLINDNREGCCLEHNKLMLVVLQYLGYEVIIVPVKVIDFPYYKKNQSCKLDAFYHVTLVVKLNGTLYSTDFGFGPTTPPNKPIELNNLQEDHDVNLLQHRIIETNISEDGEYISSNFTKRYLLEFKVPGDFWRPLYFFYLNPIFSNDLDLLNFHACYNPKSIFHDFIFLSKFTADFQYNLLNNSIRVYQNGLVIKEIVLKSEQDRRSAYKKYFGISLPDNLKEHLPDSFGAIELR